MAVRCIRIDLKLSAHRSIGGDCRGGFRANAFAGAALVGVAGDNTNLLADMGIGQRELLAGFTGQIHTIGLPLVTDAAHPVRIG